jgi:fatty-acid peroxygenase
MADLAWSLLRHGYDAIAVDRTARRGADDYESRMLGRRALVVRSREGARAFYDESLVRRRGAVPPPLAWLLFGRGAIHGLDAPEHGHRKSMFLEILTPDRLPSLVEGLRAVLHERVATWPGRDVVLHDELVRAYGRAVLEWAGVPLTGEAADARSRQLAAMVDGFGFAGPAYARAWRARSAANRWARRLVEDVRAHRLDVAPGTALEEIARSRLPARVAGVELLNVLRPTVAVAWLGTFAALRLSQHPGLRPLLAEAGGARDRFAFAQEVRRTTPFVPALAGRVSRSAQVAGWAGRKGDRIVLDVLGIDHDPGRWPEPELFDPARFSEADPGAFDLVPQGGGSPAAGHRCPGESMTLALLEVTLRVLAPVEYTLADATVDRSRIPTLPGDGLLLRVPAAVG